MVGKTIAHYEITSLLGKGGMGEVYQAKDQKLGRDVAIKVLPEEFARDADRVARFQREAKLLASLNHQNIAAIYGLEESGETNFLVMELIEGSTLADRIKTGPIPVEEALKLALQIAEALEAAHEKGVIHRDLKPANIKVTPDGKVKVLDFGLAKVFAEDQGETKPLDSPTLSAVATRQGVILGTATYMSPEQARGKPIDRRTDIWAFGVVLYEMLTGKKAFSGTDVTDTLAAVLRSEPDWGRLHANLHWRLRELLERCLEKESRNRYSGIADVRVDIQKVLAEPKGVLVQSQALDNRQSKWRLVLPWAAATLVLGLIIAGVAVWKLKPTPSPEPRQVMRFEYELPKDQQFSDLILAALAISPDGEQIVYCTNKGIYLRSMDQLVAKMIPGTEENTNEPLFSPDGKWIGYFAVSDKKWKKIPVSGGTPVILCDADYPVNASWSADDQIVYAERDKGIMRVSANGGTPELIVKKIGLFLLNPQILPDNKTVLFCIARGLKTSQIAVQSLKSGKPRILLEGSNGRYLSTGHIVYVVRNSLFAVPFNLERLEVSGSPVQLIEDVLQLNGLYTPQYSVSDSGTLVYIAGTSSASAQRTLVWVDRKGKEVPISAAPNDYSFPKISPDGTKVALNVAGGEKSDIWIWDTVRETMSRLTFDGHSAYPLWTPDGKRIAFVNTTTALPFIPTDIYWKASDGTGGNEKLGSAPGQALYPSSWSSDGNILALSEVNLEILSYDVGTLSMKGKHEWKPLLNQKYAEIQPKISPDGRWMAYTSGESGQPEIYVRPFPDVNKGRWQISTNGGHTPLWSPDGREIFYRDGDSVMAVSVETEPAFRPGKPEVLFRGNYVVTLSLTDLQPWDISPDGKRFLMMKEVGSKTSEAGGPRKINIVVNWFEELKQKVQVN